MGYCFPCGHRDDQPDPSCVCPMCLHPKRRRVVTKGVKAGCEHVDVSEAGSGWTIDGTMKPDKEITAFLHCGRCLEELPFGTAPREWARNEIGFTRDGGLQVWCVRHDINVGLMKHA